MQIVNRKSKIENVSWLPDLDSNQDKQIQSLLCYRYTIGQPAAQLSLTGLPARSRDAGALMRYSVKALKRLCWPRRSTLKIPGFLRPYVSTNHRFNASPL